MRRFANSLIVASAQTVLTVIVTSLAAYGYARLAISGKNGLFAFLMANMTFPVYLFYSVTLHEGHADALRREGMKRAA